MKIKFYIAAALLTGAAGMYAADFSARPFFSEKVVGLHGSDYLIPVGITNSGTQTISEISYKIECDGKTINGTYKFTPELGTRSSNFRWIDLEVPVPEAQGEYDMVMTIDKINGNDNENSRTSERTVLISSPIEVKNRPLVDEYTGLWCGACPMGYVALETLSEKYGHDFVAAAWHNGDAMTTMPAYPTNVPSYPNSAVNRGSLQPVNNIEANWEEARHQYTPAAISVTTEFGDDARSTLVAKAKVTFVENVDYADYGIGYILIADELSAPSWRQANNYAGSHSLVGKYAELFNEGRSMVSGLIFNDVVMGSSRAKGELNTIPASVKAFRDYEHEYTFKLTMANAAGDIIAHDKEKLRVIAYVYDRNQERIVNSCSSLYAGQEESGIDETLAEDLEIIGTLWYDLSGRKVAADTEGILIRADIHSNGKVTTKKVVNRGK